MIASNANISESNGLEQCTIVHSKIVSEYDQEIRQSQTADKPMVPRRRATQQSRDTRKTN